MKDYIEASDPWFQGDANLSVEDLQRLVLEAWRSITNEDLIK